MELKTKATHITVQLTNGEQDILRIKKDLQTINLTINSYFIHENQITACLKSFREYLDTVIVLIIGNMNGLHPTKNLRSTT